MALLLLLGTPPAAQVSPVRGAEATVPGYGAQANPTGDPVGGGTGYSNIITSGDYSVAGRDEFLAALSILSAMGERERVGKTIYVEEDANIDMGGGAYGILNLSVPSGITIASNRGLNGSPGGRIYWSIPATPPHYEHFLVVGNNVTFNGIRLQGPDGAIGTSGSDPLIDGICSSGKTGLVVENCEIYGWPYAGIAYYSDGLSGLDSPSKAYIHHNYIHRCRRSGLGYGVQVGAASALIEANIFNYCRHAIAGERGYPTSNYEARFNVVEPSITNSMFDMHGGNDTPSWGFADGPDGSVPAGGTILIHHNTFESTTRPAVGIRGVPADTCRIYNNWTYWPSFESSAAFIQRLQNLGLTPYLKMDVYDNWYGTAPPPGVSPNEAAVIDDPANGRSSTAPPGWHEQFDLSNAGLYAYGPMQTYQTFTPSVSHYFNLAAFYLYNQGTPNYTVTISLYRVDGNHTPTGSALCSTTFEASSLSTTPAWYEFGFTTGYTVLAGSEYALVLSGNGGDVLNRVVVRVNTAAGYSGGNCSFSSDRGASWVPYDYDAAFKEGQW